MMTNTTIGDLCDIQTGKLDANEASEKGSYPFFTCSRDPLKIDNYAYDLECVLIAGNGDLNVKYYKGKFNAYQRTYIVSAKEGQVRNLNVRYLYYFFSLYVNFLREKSVGAIIKYIKVGDITNAPFSYPSNTEQERIVKILDAAFEKIDRLKQNAEKSLHEIKNLWEARLSNLFEAKDGWTNSNLGSLVDFKNGVNFTPSENGTKIKFLGVGDFKDRVTITSSDLDYISTNQTIDKEYHLQKDDIIIVRSNGSKTLVGRTVIFNENIEEPLIYSGFCIRCRIKDKSLLPEFLNILFRTTKVKRHLTYGDNGCNISNINQKKLSSLQIFYPSIEDQKKIVEDYEHLSLLCKRLTFNYEQEIAEYEALKQSVLRKAFSGEL